MASLAVVVAATRSTTEVVDGEYVTLPKLTAQGHAITQDHQFPIITPLQWESWGVWLRDAGRLRGFRDIVGRSENGFLIDVSGPILRVLQATNHKPVSDNPSTNVKHELVGGHYFRLFTHSEFLLCLVTIPV
jgi:hypothetical protein